MLTWVEEGKSDSLSSTPPSNQFILLGSSSVQTPISAGGVGGEPQVDKCLTLPSMGDPLPNLGKKNTGKS